MTRHTMRAPGRVLAAVLLLLTVGCSQQPGDLAITDVTVIDPASGRVVLGSGSCPVGDYRGIVDRRNGQADRGDVAVLIGVVGFESKTVCPVKVEAGSIGTARSPGC